MRIPVNEHYGTGRGALLDYADPLSREAMTERLMSLISLAMVSYLASYFIAVCDVYFCYWYCWQSGEVHQEAGA